MREGFSLSWNSTISIYKQYLFIFWTPLFMAHSQTLWLCTDSVRPGVLIVLSESTMQEVSFWILFLKRLGFSFRGIQSFENWGKPRILSSWSNSNLRSPMPSNCNSWCLQRLLMCSTVSKHRGMRRHGMGDWPRSQWQCGNQCPLVRIVDVWHQAWFAEDHVEVILNVQEWGHHSKCWCSWRKMIINH